jgi:hypothetical protein
MQPTRSQRCGPLSLEVSGMSLYIHMWKEKIAWHMHTHASDDETRHQPDDAIAMLTADHCQVRALFPQYEDIPDPYLEQIIATLRDLDWQ